MPGYLIARLAIDAALHGQGYGEQLLLDALGKAVAASEIGGGRLIVVDAIDEAQSFYEHYHFVPVRNRERRLVINVSTAAKALGERWRDGPQPGCHRESPVPMWTTLETTSAQQATDVTVVICDRRSRR